MFKKFQATVIVFGMCNGLLNQEPSLLVAHQTKPFVFGDLPSRLKLKLQKMNPWKKKSNKLSHSRSSQFLMELIHVQLDKSHGNQIQLRKVLL